VTGYRLALVGLIGLGAVAGFWAARSIHSDSPNGLQPSPVSPTRAVHSEISESSGPSPTKPVPSNLPDFSLADVDGVKHKLSEWKGRPLMINFWATWCEPCRREIPLLKQLRHEHATEGVEVIGIAIDFRDAVQRYIRSMGVDYPVLVGEQDGLAAIAAFGMDAVFPFTVFSNRQGQIVTLKIGELHPDEARFILSRVEAVDGGTLELPVARKEIADGLAALSAQRERLQEAEEAASPPSGKH
jgi:thiol-disulfide isomerase/thioredoxin